MAASNSQPTIQLDKYTRLNSSIYYHQPTDDPNPNHTKSKLQNLILLVGWMDAKPRHLAKYMLAYEKLYPGSRILAITTSAAHVSVTSVRANKKRLAPALEVLYNTQPGEKILLHFFSNGGSITAMLLAKAYLQKTGKRLPLSGMAMDSCPGKATYAATIRAFSVGLPKNAVLHFIGIMFLNLLWIAFKTSNFLARTEGAVEETRRDLLDTQLIDVETPRVYIYSQSDQIISSADIEDHGRQAKALGYPVEMEKFEGSGHVGHAVVDPQRYWDVVAKIGRSFYSG